MQRALLGLVEGGIEEREHAPPDDRGLDHHARVDADDRTGVGQRVEEVRPGLARVGLRPTGWPDDDVG